MKKNNIKKVITIVVTIIAAAMITLSGIVKLANNAQVVTKLTRVGVGQFLPLLGFMEIAFTALFLFPKTRKVGFILLSCYFSGAIATDLSHGENMMAAAMPVILVWIAAFLLDKSIFIPAPRSEAK
ncbi:MAG TPA: DoxX family protein [Puia sp.]|nr:DoxX family protein [Puia sp.]